MSSIEQERRDAVRRHLAGETVTDICRNLGRSRKWFYKWKRRYETANPDWYQDQSRAPNQQAGQINGDIETAIVDIRQRLMDHPHARIGPQSIHWELKQLGFEPPSLSTIKRVVRRHGLTTQRQKRYRKKGTPYPEVPPWFPNSLHQVDFWGPRYIKGDGRFHSLDVIDVHTRRVSTCPSRRMRNKEALDGLIMAWQRLGLPDYAQFDNALAFRGSNRHPRSFGPVIRWCLLHKVQPVFIPLQEPWRNGYIEKFHDTLENQFFRQITFRDYNHLVVEMDDFTDYHNQEYRYSPLGGKTPNEVYQDHRPGPIDSGGTMACDTDDLPMSDGYIHVIRLIRSDLLLQVFGETFPLPDNLKYQYVVATICTKDHFIRVFDDQWNSVMTIPYRLPE